MSRTAQKHAIEVVAGRQAPGTIRLMWSISRAGAVACGLVDHTGGPSVQLEISIPAPQRHQGPLSARVLDGDRVIVLEGPHGQGQWIEDSIRGVWHMDVDGILKLTIRVSSDRVEALYARTELLSRAGIPGGRYEFEGLQAR